MPEQPKRELYLNLGENDHAQVVEDLYDRYAHILYGITLKIVGNEAMADEVLKDSFTYIFRHKSLFDESKQDLCMWMISIVRSIAKQAMVISTSQNQTPPDYVDKVHDDVEMLHSFKHETLLELVFLKGENIKDVARLISLDEIEARKLLREAVKNYKSKPEPASWK
jgi:DNA-directed RNA polymerase specialized sigma24 family protein